MKDFSTTEAQWIYEIINTHYKQFSTSKIQLAIKVKIVSEALKSHKQKIPTMKAPNSIKDQVNIPSFPPIVDSLPLAPPEKKSQIHRTSRLEEQQATCLEKISLADNFQK